MMRRVLYALAPAALVYMWFFGPGLGVNLRHRGRRGAGSQKPPCSDCGGRGTRQALRDGSALVTAALLAFALPPLVPWLGAALGSAVAIVLAKHLYGGLGKNLFNPAMVGYVVLADLVSGRDDAVDSAAHGRPRLPASEASAATLDYCAHGSSAGRASTIDALTRATPARFGQGGAERRAHTFAEIRAGSLFGDFGGRGWEWVSNLIALGGLYLLYTATIRWQIPVALLAGLLAPATALYLSTRAGYAAPGFHLFSGATMLGAFFIATDPVSAAATDRGRLIYGAGIGLLTYMIRTWGGYPDGVAFAVLLMNGAVPLIDRYTRPRIYGHR